MILISFNLTPKAYTRLLVLLSLGNALPVLGAIEATTICHQLQTPESQRLILQAQQIDSQSATDNMLRGDVFVGYQGQELFAQDLSIDTKTHIAKTDGEFRLQTRNQKISGEHAVIDLDQQKVTVEKVAYTTCMSDKSEWSLTGEDFTLEQQQSFASAYHVKLRVFDVPIAYLPYISFSLGERKSGLLAPEFGNSSQTGADLAVPYYWNIAPNFDSTITPRYMQKRGLMLIDEFRYLGMDNRGKLLLEFMTHDYEMKTSRAYAQYEHEQNIGNYSHWRTQVSHVTDTLYFHDYGTSLAGVSRIALRRYSEFMGAGSRWQLRAYVDDYQSLNSQAEPYRSLPFVNGIAYYALGLLQGSIEGNYRLLQHNVLASKQMGNIRPRLSFLVDRDPGFLHLQGGPDWLWAHSAENGMAQTQTPFLRLDGGLNFDRISSERLETLRPRIFYFWRPYVDQSELPQEFSAEAEFRPEALFAENRLSGSESLADDHRISIALDYQAGSLLSGRQWLNSRLAHSYLLADQRIGVTEALLGKQGDNVSSLEFDWIPSETLGIHVLALQDWQKAQAGQLHFRVKYRAEEEEASVTFLDYADGKQILTGALIKNVGQQWRLLGKSTWDPQRQEMQELLTGIEFQNCCWRVQLTGKAFRRAPDVAMDYQAGLLLELKGLTDIGKDKFDEIRKSSF
ncbi:MAG: LPS assembly protein LptD [Gammaproteobacteria bacterium]|nr:LPS assembly protein LptD [Gammaproteobacteria bacterium]